MEQKRVIFHIDVNSAFLSWEAVYRISQDPEALDLRTIPAAVGGEQTSRRGVVLAKSTPAKRFGVTTGEPLAQAFRKCPELTVVPSRFEVYHEYSMRLMAVLEDYSPDIEPFSIDEAFLDMTGTVHLFGEPMKTAAMIRERINRELGFTVNIGVSSNKLLSKMASDFQKPDRCHSLWPDEIPAKMWPLPVRELFFVGAAAQKKMAALGIYTIGDLARSDVRLLRAHLGHKYADLVHSYACGIDEEPVAPREPLNKGYGNSITLSRDVSDYDTACQVLLSLCETVGSRLRIDHVSCGCICVELRDWQFHNQSHQLTLPSPTDSTSVLYQNACRLLKDFWDFTPVRLIGVRTSHILEDGYSQMSLFDSGQEQRMEQFEKAVDTIRSKFGIDSIKRASFLQSDTIVGHAASKKKHLSDLP